MTGPATRFVLLRARLWQSIQPADRISWELRGSSHFEPFDRMNICRASKEMLQNSIRQQVNLHLQTTQAEQ